MPAIPTMPTRDGISVSSRLPRHRPDIRGPSRLMEASPTMQACHGIPWSTWLPRPRSASSMLCPGLRPAIQKPPRPDMLARPTMPVCDGISGSFRLPKAQTGYPRTIQADDGHLHCAGLPSRSWVDHDVQAQGQPARCAQAQTGHLRRVVLVYLTKPHVIYVLTDVFMILHRC